ncbi:HEAT repeat domain-containing protein [Nocardia camponoti]|uniref:HEAT repeat domain-containing protein n=1 Tax=Nocardia camponoti TaxID=1616106 RepID=A0A917V5Q8_9NOCA|nr:HEAT repeat domain-containing protein [Nocardia camponoti]GGK40545.1 hypothetical protein GCM10011591_10190 [Nocardia camponoti]
MTTTDDLGAARLLAEYRSAGGHGSTISGIADSLHYPPFVIELMGEWLIDLEQRWTGPETEKRALARLSLIEALNRKEARKTIAIPALISQFDHEKGIDPSTRWAAGNGIYSIPAGKEFFDELAVIAADRRFGRQRRMVVNWLGKSRHPDAVEVALAQLDDESVQGHALDALSKLRAQGVSKQVEPFQSSEFPWYRRSAERIIRYDEA